MFEVGGHYSNRKGNYTVLEINDPRMTVRYEDGITSELNVNIQRRIWENILAEEEARTMSRSLRAAKRTGGMDTRHFIKPISILAAEDLAYPGWQERVAAGAESDDLRSGDRLIYYAIENQVFFAVATITGTSFEPTAKDSFFDAQAKVQITFFPVDLDAYASNLEKAISLDSVELESQPNIKRLLGRAGSYVKISEDDFELLAELLTEITEEEEGEDEDELEEEFDD